MHVAILSQSAIADDSRVLRQGDALCSAGHQVSAVGWSGATSEPPAWPIREVSPARRGPIPKIWTGVRTAASGYVGLAVPSYWSAPVDRRFLREAVRLHADLYIANDWRVLPVAARAADRVGGYYAYDSHEFGVGEWVDRFWWRQTFPRYVEQIERRFLPGAAFCTAVSPGIAELLHERYHLDVLPTVVRNLPLRNCGVEGVTRSEGPPFTVLYHGLLLHDRNLESLIDSVAGWREGFTLTIRGGGAPRYVEQLRTLARRSPAAHRITFAPLVPPEQLVPLAAQAHIGIFPLPPGTAQREHALPNKLFEYIMAGLAVCVTDLEAMAAVVRQYGVGRTIEGSGSEDIAAAVNGFDKQSIREFSRHSLKASKELNWERERQRLTGLVAGIGAGPATSLPHPETSR